MKTPLLSLLGLFAPLAIAAAAQPALTIYNQNFAVVRDSISLDLKQGENSVVYDGATMQVEPDSVILRDPAGNPLQILEQSYRNDPLSQALLLSLFEGQEIDFYIGEISKPDRIVRGKIIRSGYVAHNSLAMRRYGNQYAMTQMAMSSASGAGEPIIQVDGKIQFGLPGRPVFPSLGDDTILKPRLSWVINAPKPLKTEAELGYITRGMTWEASYNVVAPEKGNDLDIVGWVTMDNQTGRDFADARIKLMAGDVNKLDPNQMQVGDRLRAAGYAMAFETPAPQVTEKAFDEYHLYSLERPVTLHDRETKQVEFIRASGVKSEVIYVYDGAVIDWNRWRSYNRVSLRQNEEFGSDSNSKVSVMREFKNTKENGLGIPLPKGNVRFYRADGKQLEFTGENQIDHTPKDETVRIYTGDAFDLVGERKRTNFKVDTSNKWADESFEITVRNRKTEPVTIRVVEHLLRWNNWEITDKNTTYKKLNSDEIEFLVELKPDEERKITYTVHYSW
ncbi:hypothetical protein TSACC_2475 [Terrimicrobium sacchariphilum]|uniref:DUF4139 domain-containing protein n=1 Tax=Terrimicrobium sacchariphilum TaxID=690879 RepID=A0A146G5I2_TERSA|nr:DUF4139 domain-containing protein [Terrimicrobium sacchariphilum]GAT32078.1 hypothetical protein TSACC_2475 [Terrimicrobium sacchariphilum]